MARWAVTGAMGAVRPEGCDVSVLLGDCFDVLPTLEADSIDACVSDPPYGIGFMGRKWDTFTPGAGQSRIVPNRAIESDNPNLRGRTRGPASSPSAVEYDRSLSGQRAFQAWSERWGREVLRVLKPGAHAVICGAPRSYHRMACGLEDAGFEIRDGLQWLFGQGFPKSLNIGDGLGTALKPGHEPIVLARKPLGGTVAKNVAQYGTGALNIDACRIEGVKPLMVAIEKSTVPAIFKTSSATNAGSTDEGRWPSNVMLDEEAAAMLDAQSGECGGGLATRGGDPDGHGIYGSGFPRGDKRTVGFGDVGGASRFYYVAKPSRDERDVGCSDLPMHSAGDVTGGRKEGSAGLNNPRAGAGRTSGGRNSHPTVKPIALMRWLVRLITPVGGIVLDPFAGSGTTGIAARLECRRFVGIEREAEYLAIAEARIRGIAPLFGEFSA